MSLEKIKISVFGLGKLGVPLIASFISKGFHVIGVDLDKKKIESLKNLISPVYETGVQELLNSYGEKLSVTSDGIQAVKDSDVTFVVVATPSTDDGSFSNKFVLDACELIGKGLQRKNTYHVVSITSTIMPGSMENVIKPCLEKSSGKKAGKDFGLCYNPEFIALGTVIRDFLNPDFILIGESGKKAGDKLAAIYSSVCESKPEVARMNFINAELAKISLNTFITTKISFANMLARICEKLPGANVDVVTGALGLDSRIGKKYLKGAISYGGPCFPRDNIALTTLADKTGAPSYISKVTDKFNKWQITWLFRLVKLNLKNKNKVGVLGITYKPYSNVVEEAPGFLLAKKLIKSNVIVNIYDPSIDESMKKLLGRRVNYIKSAKECIRSSDVIVLATPWKEFLKLPTSCFKEGKSRRIVIDCWRILKNLKQVKGVEYIGLGLGKNKYVY